MALTHNHNGQLPLFAGARSAVCRDIMPKLRIPTHPGHLFQLDGGHRSDLMAATIPN